MHRASVNAANSSDSGSEERKSDRRPKNQIFVRAIQSSKQT